MTGGKAEATARGSVERTGEISVVDVIMNVVGDNSAKDENHPFSGSDMRYFVSTCLSAPVSDSLPKPCLFSNSSRRSPHRSLYPSLQIQRGANALQTSRPV
jgi:hypothetical protein